MSSPKTSIDELPEELVDGIADYINHGYDLEAAKRLAIFDHEYVKLLSPEEAEEYLAKRKRMK